MSLVPVLLRPKILGLRNYLRESAKSRQTMGRDSVILLVLIMLSVSIYLGGIWVLTRLEDLIDIAYLPPGMVLGMIFFSLFFILLVSGGAHAYGALFLAHDLDLIMASPIKRFDFFNGKFQEVLISTSWIAVIILLPVIAVFGVHYQAPFAFYLVSFLLMLPFFAIPATLSMIVAIIMAIVVPAHRARYAAYGVGVISLLAIGYLLHFSASTGMGSLGVFGIFLKFVRLFSTPASLSLPSHWLAVVLGELLVPSGKELTPFIILLLSSCVTLIALSFLIVAAVYPNIYKSAYVDNRGISESWVLKGSWVAKFCGFTDFQSVMFEKDVKLLLRNSLQMMHVLMFGGICSMYLYFLSVQQNLEASFPVDQARWWKMLILSMNDAIELFVVIAVCTRFVFPCVSLEGRGFWILRVSPWSMAEILRSKIRTWYLILGVSFLLIFCLANYVLHGSLALALIKAVTTLATSYGLVGLAVGSGAVFARFDWEHESQLAASFGSMVFMLVGVLYAAASLGLTWCVLFLAIGSKVIIASALLRILAILVLLAVIVVGNYLFVAMALRTGVNRLTRIEE